MTNLLKTTLIIAISAFQLPVSFAEVVNGCPAESILSCSIQTGNTTTTTTTGTRPGLASETPGSGITTTTTTTDTTSGYSDMDTGDTGGMGASIEGAMKAAMTAIGVGTVVAATNAPPCFSTPPKTFNCLMMGAGIALAGMGAAGLNSAMGVASDLGSNDADPSTTTTTDSAVSTTTDAAVAENKAKLLKLTSDYGKAGYGVDASGNTTLPNGQKINPNMDKNALMKAGLTGAIADQYLAGVAELKAKLASKNKDSLLASDSTGSMAGAVGSGAGKTGQATVASEHVDIGRNPAAWNGFYKQFGDSLLGVPQSDIFLQVENRVNVERKAMGE